MSCCAGRCRSSGIRTWSVIYAHLSVRPPSLSSRRPRLAPAVDEVLGRVLAKAPGDRYANCREFAAALREALGLPDYDRHRRPSRRGPRWQRAKPAARQMRRTGRR